MVRKNFWICLFLLVCRSVLWGQLNGQAENAVGVQSEDSLMEALGTIPAFTIYKDNYVVTGTSFKAKSPNTIQMLSFRLVYGIGCSGIYCLSGCMSF